MKICQRHWAELKAKVDDAGLGKLVVHSGEAAAEAMTTGAFEPLLGAHNAIVANCLDVAGLTLMQANPDGSERCPLCFIFAECPWCKGKSEEEQKACRFLTWIDRAVEDQAAEARRRKLIPEPS